MNHTWKEQPNESQGMKIFEATCVMCSESLKKIILRETRNDRFAAEEIYQNTMLGARIGLECLRDSSKMKAWIFAIARAESKRYYAVRRSIEEDENRLIRSAGFYLNYSFDFTKHVEDKECVKALLSSLKKKERQLCILHYFYGLSLKEISEMLHINYSTIRSMHVRGINKMRKQAALQ
jgi:RNA polymerase sigma-70 factor (ECF subfamily)